jgi:hypothetical protein
MEIKEFYAELFKRGALKPEDLEENSNCLKACQVAPLRPIYVSRGELCQKVTKIYAYMSEIHSNMSPDPETIEVFMAGVTVGTGMSPDGWIDHENVHEFLSAKEALEWNQHTRHAIERKGLSHSAWVEVYGREFFCSWNTLPKSASDMFYSASVKVIELYNGEIIEHISKILNGCSLDEVSDRQYISECFTAEIDANIQDKLPKWVIPHEIKI